MENGGVCGVRFTGGWTFYRLAPKYPRDQWYSRVFSSCMIFRMNGNGWSGKPSKTKSQICNIRDSRLILWLKRGYPWCLSSFRVHCVVFRLGLNGLGLGFRFRVWEQQLWCPVRRVGWDPQGGECIAWGHRV